jgi:hypothetical protein
VIKYPPKILGICKQVIGFTGTLGSSTIKQISAFQNDRKKFESINLYVVPDKAVNKISNIVTYTSSHNNEREKAIKQIVV